MADGADHFSPANGLSTVSVHAIKVHVESEPASTMVEDHKIAVSPGVIPGPNDNARFRRVNGRTQLGQDVYGGVSSPESTVEIYGVIIRWPG